MPPINVSPSIQFNNTPNFYSFNSNNQQNNPPQINIPQVNSPRSGVVQFNSQNTDLNRYQPSSISFQPPPLPPYIQPESVTPRTYQPFQQVNTFLPQTNVPSQQTNFTPQQINFPSQQTVTSPINLVDSNRYFVGSQILSNYKNNN